MGRSLQQHECIESICAALGLVYIAAQPITSLCVNCGNQTQHILLQSDAMALQGEVTNPGVVPRAIQDVFDIIEKTPDRDFLLRMSMMEIYNEVGASLRL